MSYFTINSEIKSVRSPDNLDKDSTRKTLISWGDKVQLCEYFDKKGATSRRHKHPQDMIDYVVSGKTKITVGNETKILGSGDSAYVPGNIEHEGVYLEDTVMICVFIPPREEYKY